MPAVFTSSSGGDIGGGLPFTRLKGPIRAGYPITDPGSQTMTPTVNANGSAAIPMYSFINRPDMGLYAQTVTTSAGATAQTRYAVAGADATWWTSDGFGVGTALQSTAAVSQGLFISQTTAQIFTSSGGGASPNTLNSGALLVWDAGRSKLCIFSTAGANSGWFGSGVFTST